MPSRGAEAAAYEAVPDLLMARPAFVPALCKHAASSYEQLSHWAVSVLGILGHLRPPAARAALSAPGLVEEALARAGRGDENAATAAVQLLSALAFVPDGRGGACPAGALWARAGGSCVAALAACVARQPAGSLVAYSAAHVIYQLLNDPSAGPAGASPPRRPRSRGSPRRSRRSCCAAASARRRWRRRGAAQAPREGGATWRCGR